MYRKKKTNKNIIIISILIIVPILLAISIYLQPKEIFTQNIFKDLSGFIQKTVLYPFKSLSKEKKATANESYLIQKNVNSSLEKEIEELKETLELNRTLTEYEPINATILSRNKSYWFNTITIDKGKKAGIKKDMAVITKKGLIGKITNVSNYTSEIKLITSDDINFKVSIAIKTNEFDNYAILNGYDNESGLIKATGIDKTTPINIGDVALTSGLGSMFPAGIYIGTVEKIESDKYNLSKTIYIKTYQNFNDIHYVTILKVKE